MIVRSNAFSLLEMLVGIAILSLSLLPFTTLLSQANKKSVGSISPVVASQLASELCEQLLLYNSSPGYKRIAGRKDLADLLTALNPQLSDQGTPPYPAPRIIPLGQNTVGFIVSPLTAFFCERRLEITRLGPGKCAQGEWYQVNVVIGWNFPGEEITGRTANHFHRSTVFIRKDN